MNKRILSLILAVMFALPVMTYAIGDAAIDADAKIKVKKIDFRRDSASTYYTTGLFGRKFRAGDLCFFQKDSSLRYYNTGQDTGLTDTSRWDVIAVGAFSTMSDVSVSGQNGGEFLISRGGKWVNDSMGPSGTGDAWMDSVCTITVTDVTVGSDAAGDLLYKSSATALARLAKGTSAQFLQMNSGATAPQWSSFSGDITVAAGGATTVTDFTIASQAQGDILYFNGTDWARLGAGTSGYYLKTQGAAANPAWDIPAVGTASILANPTTVECGAYDYSWAFDAPAAARTVRWLDPAATDTVVYVRATQTLNGKTLTAPRIANGGYIADASGNELIIFTTTGSAVNEMTLANAATGGNPSLTASGETNVSLSLIPKGTGNVKIGTGAASGTLSSSGNYDLVLQTGNSTTGSITVEDAADGDITLAVNGGGKTVIASDTVDVGVGDAAVYLMSNGAYNLTLGTNMGTDGGTLVMTQGANAHIVVTPNGTGNVQLVADEVTIGDNNANAVLTTSGTGDLTLSTNSGTNSGTVVIADAANGDITATPNGTGQTRLLAPSWTVTNKADVAATLTEAEGGVILVANTAARTYVLPAAATSSGLWYTFKKTSADAQIITIDANGAELIDGAATVATMDAQYDCITIVCDGTGWHVTQYWIH